MWKNAAAAGKMEKSAQNMQTLYADFDSKFVRNLLRLCFNRGFQEANLVIIFDI